MYPHEILSAALKGHRKAVADRLHVSVSLVDQWCNDPEQSMNRSPLDRIIEITRKVREVAPDTAEMIPQYINEQLGYLPPIRVVTGSKSLNEVAVLLKETAEFLAATAEATADGRITLAEAERMRKEVRDVIAIAQQIDVTLGQEIERLQFKKGAR